MAFEVDTQVIQLIIKTTIWLLPVAVLIDMQVVKHYKTCSSHTSQIYHMNSLGYTISQAPLQKQVRRISLILCKFYVA